MLESDTCVSKNCGFDMGGHPLSKGTLYLKLQWHPLNWMSKQFCEMYATAPLIHHADIQMVTRTHDGTCYKEETPRRGGWFGETNPISSSMKQPWHGPQQIRLHLEIIPKFQALKVLLPKYGRTVVLQISKYQFVSIFCASYFLFLTRGSRSKELPPHSIHRHSCL